MRVLHVHSGNLYGGVETFLVTLAREARQAPEMAPAFALCFEGRLTRELTAAGASVHKLGQVRLSRPDSVWRARQVLAERLRHESFDVIVCHQPWPYVIFGRTIRAAGLPLVLWVHMAGNGRHWLERLARRTRPDLVICNSRFSAACLSRWFPDTRLEHVYYPMSLSPSAGSGDERESIRRSLGTATDDVVIVQVSRLEAWKGHRILLAALARIRDVSGWTCWIVGGPQRPTEARYLAELNDFVRMEGTTDRVRFVGERTDVPALLHAADVFCQPNIEPEPFGLSLVEALNAGLPVVSSNIGGACEIVDESCGVLVPPRDIATLAAALRRLVTDRHARLTLGRQAQNRPLVLCDAQRQMRRIQQLFESVVQPSAISHHLMVQTPPVPLNADSHRLSIDDR